MCALRFEKPTLRRNFAEEEAERKAQKRKLYELRVKEARELIRSAIQKWKQEHVPSGEVFDRQRIGELVAFLSNEKAGWLGDIISEFENREVYPERPAIKLFEGQDGEWPDVWLLAWRGAEHDADQTDIHDHEDSEAAFRVHQGTIREIIYGIGDQKIRNDVKDLTYGMAERELQEGSTATIGAPYIHLVGGKEKQSLAVTIHAYYPPLDSMNLYTKTEDGRLRKSGHWEEDRTKTHC